MFIILPKGTGVYTDVDGSGQPRRVSEDALARLHSVLGEGLLVSILEDGKGMRLTEYREYVWVRGLDPRMIFFTIEDAREVLESLAATGVASQFGCGHA